MAPVAATILERLTAAHRRGGRLVLVFDYDGTLTPLVAHPRLAHLDPALRQTMAELAATRRSMSGWSAGEGWTTSSAWSVWRD
jgi:trehalose-6-phosphatase